MRDNSMLSSRSDPRVPLVFAISSKMSSTPTQICLFRNYNYGGGEMSDAFVMDPLEAKEELGVELEDDIYKMSGMLSYDGDERIKSPRTGASRHPGKFMFNASMKIILSFSYPLTKYQDHFECYKELHSELQVLPRQFLICAYGRGIIL